MNFDHEFFMEFSKLCLAEILRDVQFWSDSWAKKIDLVHVLPIKTIITAESIILS